jgi:hypothetical protein
MKNQVKNDIGRRGMDLTNTLQTVQPNFYRFANDIELSSHEAGEDLAFKRADSMLYLWNTGVQYVQNKQYKIIDLYDGDGGNYDITITYKDIDVIVTGTFADFVTFMTAVQAALVGANITCVVNSSYTTNTGSISLTGSTDGSVPPFADFIINNLYGIEVQVAQDAVDYSMMGSFKPIGGNEFNEYQLQFETTALFEPLKIQGKNNELRKTVVTDVADNGSGRYRITFGYWDGIAYQPNSPLITPSTLYVGRQYHVVLSTDTINGEWIGEWINDYTLDIIGSTFSSTTVDENLSITFYQKTCSRISVYKKELKSLDTENTDVAALDSITSTKLNFRIQNRINSVYEQNVFGDAFYWTDNLNVPRKIYSNYPTKSFQDIKGGDYSLDNIYQEIALWKDTSSSVIEFTRQQGAGQLKAGNYRYTGTFLTDFGATESQFLIPTNPINVEDVEPGAGYKVPVGHDGDYVTTKSNTLTISGFSPGIYKYFVLYAIQYVDGGILTTRVKNYLLGSQDTSIEVTHTGNEPEAEIVDTPQIQYIANIYKTAKSIDIIENRMILSNLKAVELFDLSQFALSFKHQINKTELDACVLSSVFEPSDLSKEYNDPTNVNEKLGYMPNEVYRFAAVFETRDGRLIPYAFYVDDIMINTKAVNENFDGDPVSSFSDPTRRDVGGTYTDFSITGSDVIKAAYVSFTNIDPDFKIGGEPVKNLIRRIHIVRAECIKEILSTGVGSLMEEIVPAGNVYDEDTATSAFFSSDIFAYYSADENYNADFYKYQTDDKFVNFGAISFATYTNGSTDIVWKSVMNNAVDDTDIAPLPTIMDGKFVSNNTTANVSTKVASKQYYVSGTVLKLDADALQITANNTKLIFGQIYRKKYDKYGDSTYGNFLFTGNYVDIGIDDNTPTDVDVYGGDTFVGHHSFQLRWEATSSRTGNLFYTLARVNQRARTKIPSELMFPVDSNWYSKSYFENFNYNDGYSVYGNNAINYIPAFNGNVPYIKEFPQRVIYTSAKPNGSIIEDYASFLPTNYVDYETRYGEITTHARLNRRLAIWQEGRFFIQPIRSDVLLNDATGSQVIVGTGGVAFSQVPQDVSYYGTQHKYSVVIGSSRGGNDEVVWWDAANKAILRFGLDGVVPISDEFRISSWLNNNLNFLDKDNTTDKAGEGIHGVYLPNKGQYIFTVRGLNYNLTEHEARLPNGLGKGKSMLSQYYFTPDNGFANHELSGDVGTVLYAPEQVQDVGQPLFPISIFGTTTAYNGLGFIRDTRHGLQTYPISRYLESLYTGVNPIKQVEYRPKDLYTEYTIIYDTGEQSFVGFKSFQPRIYLPNGDTCISCMPKDGYDIWKEYTNPQGVRMFLHKQVPAINQYYLTDDTFGSLDMNPYVEIILNRDKDVTKIPIGVRVQNVQAIDKIEFISITNDFTNPQSGDGCTYLNQADFTQEGSWWYAPIKYGVDDLMTDPSTGNQRFSGNVIIARVFLNKTIDNEYTNALLKDIVIKYATYGRNVLV